MGALLILTFSCISFCCLAVCATIQTEIFKRKKGPTTSTTLVPLPVRNRIDCAVAAATEDNNGFQFIDDGNICYLSKNGNDFNTDTAMVWNNDNDLQTETTCEMKTFSLTCLVGLIDVITTTYGRQDMVTCWHQAMFTTDCRTEENTNFVQQSCNDKKYCEFLVSGQIFNDPCAGTYKYLTVEYFCR